MNLVKRVCGHTWMILRHKYWVFRFCCIAGIPWQGFMHDWSKFSPTEFIESVKYYNGKFNAYQRTYVLQNFSENIKYLQYYIEHHLPKRVLKEKNVDESFINRLESIRTKDGKIKIDVHENKNFSNIPCSNSYRRENVC